MNTKIYRLISIFIFLLISYLVSTSGVKYIEAATISSTSSGNISSLPTSGEILDKLKKIEILKEKIATKVAEIRATEKRGVSGLVKSIDKNSLILKSQNEDISIPYSDDTTVYALSNQGKSEIAFKKLKEGDFISVLGYLNDLKSTTLSAKYIYLQQKTLRSIGKIADIDKTNYTISVNEPKGNTLVDIETYTKISTYSKDKGLLKSGFSKLKVGDLVHVVGNPNANEENRMSAVRIMSLQIDTSLSPTIFKEISASSSPTPSKKKS